MGFGQGLSGLNAASQNLDVIGNNIANSGTVGFKAGSATFADVYASSRVGLGVQVASVNQRFTTGTVSSTGNQFDMAIDGANGLFVVKDSGGQSFYTRNGQFFSDKNNNIVNSQGQQLMGYAPGGTTLVGLTVPTANIPPQATSTLTNTVNLDANAAVVPATTTFDPADAASFSNMTPVTVYDSLGNSHTVQQYYTKRDPAGGNSVWEVNYVVDGTVDPANTATLAFNSAGSLASGSPATISFTPGGSTSPAAPMGIQVVYGGSTQFGGSFSQNFIQDGYSTGEYASMSIGADGSLVANYTNGATKTVGTLALANFNNLQGLQPVGGNAWAETADSGQAILGTPGSNGLAQIKGQAVEESNVDMSQELVNMIIAQRTYQANAQTIKTQDQVLQTLINMS